MSATQDVGAVSDRAFANQMARATIGMTAAEADAKYKALEDLIEERKQDEAFVAEAVSDLLRDAEFPHLVARMVIARKRGQPMTAEGLLHAATFEVFEQLTRNARQYMEARS